MSVSRRRLFGLLAGAAAAPMVKAAGPDLWLDGVPIYYDRFSDISYRGVHTLIPKLFWVANNGHVEHWPGPEGA